MAEHTPTPWSVLDELGGDRRPGIKAGDVTIIEAGSSYYGAGVDGRNGRANAEFIVRAVNAYDVMANALRESRLQLIYLDSRLATGSTSAVVSLIDMALAKAEAKS